MWYVYTYSNGVMHSRSVGRTMWKWTNGRLIICSESCLCLYRLNNVQLNISEAVAGYRIFKRLDCYNHRVAIAKILSRSLFNLNGNSLPYWWYTCIDLAIGLHCLFFVFCVCIFTFTAMFLLVTRFPYYNRTNTTIETIEDSTEWKTI